MYKREREWQRRIHQNTFLIKNMVLVWISKLIYVMHEWKTK